MTYVVLTAEPSKLRKVRRRLRRKGYTAYLPAIARVRAIAKGSKIKRKRHVTPLMSYILVKAPCDGPIDKAWLVGALSTRDVRGVLRSPTEPWPSAVPDDIVALLKLTVKQLVVAERLYLGALRAKWRPRKGAKARVREGTLAGKAGTVQWVRGAKAGLEAQLFGSMRVVEVKAKDLEAA